MTRIPMEMLPGENWKRKIIELNQDKEDNVFQLK